MNTEAQAVKQRILQAVIDLIQELQSFEKVSMRKIAERAGVAVSMVNYHYQTKENLVNQAVQAFIGRVIERSEAPYVSDGDQEGGGHTEAADPVDSMRKHLKGAARFMADNPGISRVSILHDMKVGSGQDNTSQVVDLVGRQLKLIFPEQHDPLQLQISALMQVAAVQHLFLRADYIKKETGFDFYNESQRNQLMDTVINTTVGSNKTSKET